MEMINLNLESLRILSKNITDYMALNDLNPESFGTKCGTSKQQIYSIMRGTTTPRVDFLDRLANGMGITTAELLTEGYFDQFEKQIVKKK
jgi:transcriptional regulator with XRE-family HTH domain